jgi:hypothetical protein
LADMIPVWVWIILLMGLILLLHIIKVKLRRWAWKSIENSTYSFSPLTRANVDQEREV